MKLMKKCILFFILFAIIIYLIFCTYNFIILTKISSLTNSNYSTNNIYFEKNIDNSTLVKYSKLNNLEKIETIKKDSPYQITLNNYDTNEYFDFYLTNNSYNKRISKPDEYPLPTLISQEENNVFSLILKSTSSIITTTTLNHKDCFIVSTNSKKYYIEKETGFILKEESTISINNKKETKSIIYKNWKFNTLTEDNFLTPDLNNFILQNNNI